MEYIECDKFMFDKEGLYMKKSISRIIGLTMLIIAIVFIMFALNHPEMSFKNLKRFAGIITTDYSMLPEMLPGQNIWNCTRNRVMAYYLQMKGFNIIPVASWCFESDFEWCFDGLPKNSSIAISTNGCMSSPYGKRMLLRGVKELQKQKSPTNLIVCGRHVDELDIYDNVHYYPSFSQRWKERAM